MSRTVQSIMTGALMEMCEGLHPLPDGWMFVGILTDENVAMRATLIGDKLRIGEDDGDAYSDGFEGSIGQAADSNDTSGNDGVQPFGESHSG